MRPPAEMACWEPSPATQRTLGTTLAAAAALVAVALFGLAALIASTQVLP